MDKELEIIKINKTKKGCKNLYNNNQFFYYSFINLLENLQNWKNINYICSSSTYYRNFKLWTINNVFINVYKIYINFLKK